MSAESTRPLLLPQNRKLRHLRGISLRNLAFTRPRGRTIDDAALNKSPAKLESLRNSPQIHHTLSSEQLRPGPGRRRSTNLVGASPVTRQKRIEDTFDSKLADAFFSLHVEREEEPVYISEVAERATNFNFSLFELSELDSTITQTPRVTIKIWTNRHDTWSLLLEDDIDLRALNWLGTMQNVPFPPNSLVFHMVDGIYSLELSNKYPPPKKMPPTATSSYNALMRLATLDNSIQDALATRESLTRQINDLLAKETPNQVPAAQDSLALAEKYLAVQKRTVEASKTRNQELRASIEARRSAIAEGRALQERAETDVNNATEKLAHSKTLLARTKEQIHGQRRRICEDLDRIWRINSVSTPGTPPLTFTICGLPLPNTIYDDALLKGTGSDTLSAALGYVAQLTDNLQCYLGVPLPYPIRPYGSRSTIRDEISQLPDTQRDFPLYVPRGGSSAQYRFDYGWFLLNKDIETLCVSQGLKVVDIRHTLPNLKYLLYVCSAGTDEIPDRKRGGVRGLWAGRYRNLTVAGMTADDEASSFGGSRRGSDASSVVGGIGQRRGEDLRGKIIGGSTGNGGVAGFEEAEVKMTLRTKGMRESVAQ
ncbi:Putative UV radiation resistance-associated gene protein [Podospora comata]|uniref:Autophagy-related protein 14 n=1 Tax=Podospora comata TaxID=48703 RepID=A0ABY6RT38_PODCO|nr:Putative UV radiation resistance-associated gene protein [Podospora comata]